MRAVPAKKNTPKKVGRKPANHKLKNVANDGNNVDNEDVDETPKIPRKKVAAKKK